jgi:hypothetical protein
VKDCRCRSGQTNLSSPQLSEVTMLGVEDVIMTILNLRSRRNREQSEHRDDLEEHYGGSSGRLEAKTRSGRGTLILEDFYMTSLVDHISMERVPKQHCITSSSTMHITKHMNRLLSRHLCQFPDGHPRESDVFWQPPKI